MKISRFFGVLSIAAVLIGCRGPKLDAPAAASLFFEQLARGDIQKAYESAAFSFQTEQTLKSFEYTVEALGMENHSAVVWTHKQIGEKEAKLDGEITKADGAKQSISVIMIWQSGAWKLHRLRTVANAQMPAQNVFTLVGKGASFNDSYRRALPSEQEIRRIVLASVLDFNAAIQKGNFGDFYKNASVAWQSQLTERKLQNAFQGFIDAGVKLDGVKSVEAVFDSAPEINGEGLLVVSGYFPTTPNRVVFSMKFIYELPKWRLFGLNINLVRAE